jgi:hypothetical protein
MLAARMPLLAFAGAKLEPVDVVSAKKRSWK